MRTSFSYETLLSMLVLASENYLMMQLTVDDNVINRLVYFTPSLENHLMY